MGRYNLGEGADVVAGGASGVGVEPRNAEGLGVCGPSTMRERDSMALGSVLILSTSAWTTSGLLAYKQLARAPKQSWLALMIKNRFAIVLNVIPWRPLKRR